VVQGGQIVFLNSKNSNLGILCRVLELIMLVFLIAMYIYGHLVYFVFIGIFSRFGVLYQEKSGMRGEL
jgi:hypothetical protein